MLDRINLLPMNYNAAKKLLNRQPTAQNKALAVVQKTAFVAAAAFTALAETIRNVFTGIANLAILPINFAVQRLNKEVAEEVVDGIVLATETVSEQPQKTLEAAPTVAPVRSSKLKRIASSSTGSLVSAAKGTARLVRNHPVKTAALVAAIAAGTYGYYIGIEGVNEGIASLNASMNNGLNAFRSLFDAETINPEGWNGGRTFYS